MDAKQLQRFHNEALAAASLKHEHIVQVYAVGCERGVHFYAMEFVEGQTLAAVIDEMRGEGAAKRRKPVVAAPHNPAAVSVAGLSEAAPRVRMTRGPGSVTPATEVAALSTQQTRRDKAHFRQIAELTAQAAYASEYSRATRQGGAGSEIA